MSTCVDETVLVNEYIKHSNISINQKGYHIKDIFKAYWDSFLNDNTNLNIRPAVYKSIKNILRCRTFDNGYFFLECPNCDNYHMIFHTCKDRFCNSCGIKYAKARANALEKVSIDCNHRHITFTVPKELRNVFRKNRNLLSELFEAVNDTFKWLSKKHGKSRKWKLGYVLVLHTFGRPLTFNTHIHALVTEGMVDRLGNFKEMKYFDYELLRKSFQKSLLDRLHHLLGNSFYPIKCKLYNDNQNGFYVYGPDKLESAMNHKQKINYVVRYTGRPVMAESRIIDINYINNEITYFYHPHQDDNLDYEDKTGKIIVTEHIYEFIKKLIIHIPNIEFKTIRYYGIYSSKGKPLIPNYKIKKSSIKFLFNLKWRWMIKKSFNFDPVLCSCGLLMKINLNSSYFPP